jgi:hypothetical protein
MSGEERRGSQRKDFATPTEAQLALYQALQAHKFDLENRRSTSAREEEILGHRIETVQRLVEWLEQDLEIEPAVSLPSLSTRRWINHSGDASDGSGR